MVLANGGGRALRRLARCDRDGRGPCVQQHTCIVGCESPPGRRHSGPVSKPNCVAARRGGEHGGGEPAARRMTNAIRLRKLVSLRNMSETRTGDVPERAIGPYDRRPEGLPAKGRAVVSAVGGDGTSRSARMWTGESCPDNERRPYKVATGSSQSRHSTVETGESRRREGRQELGCERNQP